MRPRELFGVIVRTGGVTCLLFGIFDAIHIAAKIFGLPDGSQRTMSEEVFATAVWFIIGAAILACAEMIVRLAYGPDHQA